MEGANNLVATENEVLYELVTVWLHCLDTESKIDFMVLFIFFNKVRN